MPPKTTEIETIVDFAIPDKEERDLRWELRSRLCTFREEAYQQGKEDAFASAAKIVTELL